MKGDTMSEHEGVSHESISSVELTRNAKGGTQIKVKVYNEDPGVASTKCIEIYNSLCETYAVEN